MPSHAAMTEKFLSLRPDDDVEKAMEAMTKNNAAFAPVVDEDGKVVGAFSLEILLENTLPVSVAMNDVIGSVNLSAAPGIAKRLKKVLYLKVGDLMERKFPFVYPETPLWEGVGLLVQNGTPMIVIDQKTGKALGIMTAQSAVNELNRLKDSET